MLKPACLLLCALLPLAAQNPAEAQAEAAIRALVQSYLDSRDHRDAKLLATLFTADVDQLVSSGEWRRGRPALVEGTLASSARESGKRTVEVETIRFLSPDIAIADGRYTIAAEAGAQAAPAARRMWSTFILKREDNRWKIAAIRNMLPAGR